jgi:hypothetical protein
MTPAQLAEIKATIIRMEQHRFRLLDASKSPSGKPGTSAMALVLREEAQFLAAQICALKQVIGEV